MAYAAWSVTFGEQPSAAKWNILGTNDASFNDGTGIASGAITYAKAAAGFVVQDAITAYSAVATGSTLMIYDDTPPTSSEGDQYMTITFTPKATTNTLIIDTLASLSSSAAAGNAMIGAIYQDATATSVAAGYYYTTAVGSTQQLRVVHTMTAGTTSATTFKYRAGCNSAGTTTFNGAGGARLMNTTNKSFIRVTEIKV